VKSYLLQEALNHGDLSWVNTHIQASESTLRMLTWLYYYSLQLKSTTHLYHPPKL